MSGTINICLSSDNNYARHLQVTLLSILENKTPKDRLCIYIIDGGISKKNKGEIANLEKQYNCVINFVKIDAATFANCPLPATMAHISVATYFRFTLAHLLKQVDKVLYLDCDLIVKSSLDELYNQDLDDNYFKGVIDVIEDENKKRLNLKKYCNAGVMLINLKKWREENIEEKLFEYTKNNHEKIVYVDQDVLNVVLQEKIEYLDKKWNAQVSNVSASVTSGFNKLGENANIVHFIGGKKPWDLISITPYKKLYLKYLKKVSPIQYMKLKIFSPLAFFRALRKKNISIKRNKKENL